MNNVKSLRAGIFSEIIIVMLPLTALLIYQTVSDITAFDRLAGAYRLHAATSTARHNFSSFVNGVVDAVDTGRVAQDAVSHLQAAEEGLKSITGGDRTGKFGALAARMDALLAHLHKDRSLQGLLPLRETINGVDTELAALDRGCDEASRAEIQANINSALTNRAVVFAALLAGVVATAFLISRLIRHINQFEEALRESEERMRVMFESVNAGIVLIDCATRTIADVNPAALRMYGGAKEELVGRSCLSLFHSGDDTVCPILDEGKALDNSKKALTLRNGEQLPILKSVNNVMVNGRPYLLESFVDLSEQAALEAELVAAKEAAEAASRAKSIFLAGMSHEIRTPMNAILGYLQLLRRERDLAPQQENYLDIINRSGEHLLKLINDILEMSKIEAGTINLTVKAFNFHGLLKDIESLFSVRTSQKKVRFSIDLTGYVPMVLNTDEGKVRQVLINLISNSFKFTDHGEITVRIAAEPASLDDGPGTLSNVTVTVDVEDSGSGIAVGEFDEVFAPFEQTESGRHRIGGTGLGMPISRQFARLMGGDLVLLRSEPGVGSVFRFTFKAEVLDTAPCTGLPPADRCVRRIAPDGKEWRVLVVDDQETNRGLLSQVLTQAGFTVREAGDGASGVARFREWLPDIVLMDILMPEMDGYEAMRQIKATAAGAEVPIVAITASVMMEERQKALDSGFDGFIMKPVQMKDLFEEIRRLTHIAYLYEENSSRGDAAVGGTPLCAADLAAMPDDLLAAMRDALDAGDMTALRRLIGRVGESEPAVATALGRLVDTYAYDTLTELLVGEESTNDNT